MLRLHVEEGQRRHRRAVQVRHSDIVFRFVKKKTSTFFLFRSMDTDGLPICYLHRPNGCRDAIDSQAFCGMQVPLTAVNCLQKCRQNCIILDQQDRVRLPPGPPRRLLRLPRPLHGHLPAGAERTRRQRRQQQLQRQKGLEPGPRRRRRQRRRKQRGGERRI